MANLADLARQISDEDLEMEDEEPEECEMDRYVHTVKPSMKLTRDFFTAHHNALTLHSDVGIAAVPDSIALESNAVVTTTIALKSENKGNSRRRAQRKGTDDDGWRSHQRLVSGGVGNNYGLADFKASILTQKQTEDEKGKSSAHTSGANTPTTNRPGHNRLMPSLALSLAGGADGHFSGESIGSSPFFDPSFWNDEFSKMVTTRRAAYTVKTNFDIDDSDDDDDDDNAVNGKAEVRFMDETDSIFLVGNGDVTMKGNFVDEKKRTEDEIRLQKLTAMAKVDIFIDKIRYIFHPNQNKRWLDMIVGSDVKQAELQQSDSKVDLSIDNNSGDGTANEEKEMDPYEKLMEDFYGYSASHATEHDDNESDSRNISLVPKLIHFSGKFFKTKEAEYIFQQTKQSIEVLVSDESDRGDMLELLYRAFEKKWNPEYIKMISYSRGQILQTQIRWVRYTLITIEDNPFLTDESFQSPQVQDQYMEEYKSQLNQELDDLEAQLDAWEEEQSMKQLSKRERNKALKNKKKQNADKSSGSGKSKKKGKPKMKMFAWFSKLSSSKDDKKEDPEFIPMPLSKAEIRSSQHRLDLENENRILDGIRLDGYSMFFVLLCLLLRHHNPKRNILQFHISTKPIRLPFVAERILNCFATTKKVSFVYRILCYLKIYMKCLCATSQYFEDVYSRLETLQEFLEDESTMYTYREEIHVQKIITRFQNWCSLCVLRYQHVFRPPTGIAALNSCLKLWKYCVHFSMRLKLVETDMSIFEELFTQRVQQTVRSAVFDFEFPRLVSLYKRVSQMVDSNTNISDLLKSSTTSTTIRETELDYLPKLDSNVKSTDGSIGGSSSGNVLLLGNTAKSSDTFPVNTQSSLIPTLNTKISADPNDPRLRSDTGLGRISENIMREGSNSVFGKAANLIRRRSKDPSTKDSRTTKRITAIAEEKSPTSATEDTIETPVDDACQLIMVLKSCVKFLELDQEEFVAPFKTWVPNLQFVKTTANQYMSLGFSFANIYLRVLSARLEEEMEQRSQHSLVSYVMKEDEQYSVDPNIWSLYQELRRFYDRLSQLFTEEEMPRVKHDDHYRIIIQYWTRYQSYKYTNHRNGIVHKILQLDKFEPLSDKVLPYSSSVIDVFALMEPLQMWFTELPYTNETLVDFAQLLSSIVSTYVRCTQQQILTRLQTEIARNEVAFFFQKSGDTAEGDAVINSENWVWEIPQDMIIMINNILMAKTQLIQMLEKNMLERRYSKHPITKLEDQKSEVEIQKELDAEEAIFDKLNCADAFRAINSALETISFTFAEAINADLKGEIFLIIWDEGRDMNTSALAKAAAAGGGGKKSKSSSSEAVKIMEFPIDREMTASQIENELMEDLWKKLVVKCDAITCNIMPAFTPYLLNDTFGLMCRHLFSLMIPQREKYVLHSAQLNRIEHSISELQSFFIEAYSISKDLITKNEYLYQCNAVLQLLKSDHKSIINHYSVLSTDPKLKNEYQMSGAPFVGPKALWLILKHRKKLNPKSEALAKYFKEKHTLKAKMKNIFKSKS